MGTYNLYTNPCFHFCILLIILPKPCVPLKVFLNQLVHQTSAVSIPETNRSVVLKSKIMCTNSLLLRLLIAAGLLATATAAKVTSHNYTDALAKSILFFEGQRSGKLPNSQRMSWRKDSALHDGSDIHVSLSSLAKFIHQFFFIK